MKAIVFDFGNVVGFFDYRRTLVRLRQHTDLSEDEIRAAVVADHLADEYEKGRISSDQFLRHIHDRCRLRCTLDESASAFMEIFEPNPEVCALLPQLQGRYRLLLGSNTCELHTRQFRRQFADKLRCFDHLVLSFEIGARKPEREFFDHCLRNAGCTADECLFIDDLEVNVAGAKACGWHGIVYRPGEDLPRQLQAFGVTWSI